MAAYRALMDLSTPIYITAGTVFSDGVTSAPGVPQLAPPGWPPPPAVEPIDGDALQQFFAQGPAQLQISPLVPPPKVYWRQVTLGTSVWQLTGAGAALGTADWSAPRGARP